MRLYDLVGEGMSYFPLSTRGLAQSDICRASYVGRESPHRVTLREQHGGAPSLLDDGQPVVGSFLVGMGLWSELALVGRL